CRLKPIIGADYRQNVEQYSFKSSLSMVIEPNLLVSYGPFRLVVCHWPVWLMSPRDRNISMHWSREKYECWLHMPAKFFIPLRVALGITLIEALMRSSKALSLAIFLCSSLSKRI